MPALRFVLLVPVLAAAAVAAGSARSEPARPLPFFYDLYTFRGPGGSTEVVSSFAVEAGNLETEHAGGAIRYRFSVTLVLADTVLRTVSNTHDTVYVDVGRRFPDEHLLFTHVTVAAPPSRTTRQRMIMIDATSPGIGQLYTETIPIPDYGGSQLMLSDIAFGRPDATIGWKRGDAILGILPTTRFPPAEFDIYYEVYNLPAGNDYRTEIAIERTDSAAPAAEPIRLRFAGESSTQLDGVLPQLRRVDASLSRGSYRLTVTITDLVSGTSVTRSRPFDVLGEERGATAVSAFRRTHSGR